MEKVNKLFTENCIKILIGSISAIVVSIIGFFIFATILTCTDINESTIPSVVIITSLISILIGSSISSRKIRKKGIINGALVGVIYVSTIYVLSSILLVGFNLNTYSIIMILGAVGSGMIGGIVGVNLSK